MRVSVGAAIMWVYMLYAEKSDVIGFWRTPRGNVFLRDGARSHTKRKHKQRSAITANRGRPIAPFAISDSDDKATAAGRRWPLRPHSTWLLTSQ